MDLMERFGERIEEVEREMERLLEIKKPENLYVAARHLPLAGGKRLRPLISILSAEVVGGDWRKVVPFSVSLELLHNFTLVHDDIMDRSTMRRGVETVHVKFGEDTAIIAGDILFAKAYESLHNLDVDPVIFKRLNLLLTTCIEEICEGQEIDMEFEGRTDITEEEYIEMINKKTAALFSCSAEGGGIIGGGEDEEVKALSRYGRYFGLGFQIWDDYLDLKGSEREFGKRIGNDIREGKKTLMIIHALSNADQRDREKILSILGKKDASNEEIKEIVEILERIGSLDYAKERAMEFSRKAKESLSNLQNNEARSSLEELVDYSISRRR
ncbi:MAG TPA: polyprenyl synthetase family protein [Thermoplasmatales archaeon]|nr:polyprenyl synthetase family protein [Thermoplasmatales archaeon]HEX17442.1 polyprenyl synthetase family protein [Thermoplasmatales archaeon]